MVKVTTAFAVKPVAVAIAIMLAQREPQLPLPNYRPVVNRDVWAYR
jgi:hypothetical protein